MPELPEVETVRRGLEKKVIGKKITGLKIVPKRVIRSASAQLRRALIGQKFTKLERRGKLLVFGLHSNSLLIHLGMTGQLIYRRKNEELYGGHSLKKKTGAIADKYSYFVVKFADDSTMAFNDMRLFGFVKVVNGDELAQVLKKYGAEPLGPDFTDSYLRKILQSRQRAIKTVIMDQTLIAGVGNIYADESLYGAKIRPTRLASRVTVAETSRLRNAIQQVLKLAISKRGTTVSNFVDAKGRRGEFANFLNVYGRGKEVCKKCSTPIKKIVVGGRGTHYCPKCQK